MSVCARRLDWVSLLPSLRGLTSCRIAQPPNSIRGGHHASGERPFAAPPGADEIDDQTADQNRGGVADLCKRTWTFVQDKGEPKNRQQCWQGVKPHPERTRRLRML